MEAVDALDQGVAVLGSTDWLRHLDALGITGHRNTLPTAALTMAAIIDSDEQHNQLRHRAATVELIGLLGTLARAKIIKTATTGPGVG